MRPISIPKELAAKANPKCPCLRQQARDDQPELGSEEFCDQLFSKFGGV